MSSESGTINRSITSCLCEEVQRDRARFPSFDTMGGRTAFAHITSDRLAEVAAGEYTGLNLKHLKLVDTEA